MLTILYVPIFQKITMHFYNSLSDFISEPTLHCKNSFHGSPNSKTLVGL
uniref:Uncharacterized protein n=1 Tax=Arundo donax TaxID=35708 RepID=A0A0A9GI31_ARUDO